MIAPVAVRAPVLDTGPFLSEPSSVEVNAARWVQLTWCLAAIPYLVAAIVSFNRVRSGHNIGNMADFLDASRAMLAHQNIYDSGKGGYVYPPLIAFLYQPLAGLTNASAGIIVLGLELIVGVITLVMISRVLVHRLLSSSDSLLIARAALLGAILTADKIKGEFAHLETNVLMLLAYTTAMRWVDKKPWLCGLALGFAFNIKYLPIVLLPWLLFRRRWQAAVWFGVFALGFALLPALSLGLHGDARAWVEATGGIGRLFGIYAQDAHVARVRLIVDAVSISATSGLARVTGFTPRVTELLAAGIAAALAAYTVILYTRIRMPIFRWPASNAQQGDQFKGLFTAEWLGVLLLLLALSPFTNSRHLYMLLDVNIAAAVLLLGVGGRVTRVPLIVATVLMFAGITFPPGGSPVFDRADHFWRTVGGPGWCMLGMFLALLWTNTQWVRVRAEPMDTDRSTPLST